MSSLYTIKKRLEKIDMAVEYRMGADGRAWYLDDDTRVADNAEQLEEYLISQEDYLADEAELAKTN